MSIQTLTAFTNNIKPVAAFTAHTALRTTAWVADQCAKKDAFSVVFAAGSIYLNWQHAQHFQKEMQKLGCIRIGDKVIQVQPTINSIREAINNIENDITQLPEKIAPIPDAPADVCHDSFEFYFGAAIVCTILATPPVRSFIFGTISQIATHLDQSF